MPEIPNRRVAAVLTGWTVVLMLGALAPGHGPPAAGVWPTRLGAVPAKGISPTCLLVPQDSGCEGGIIS